MRFCFETWPCRVVLCRWVWYATEIWWLKKLTHHSYYSWHLKRSCFLFLVHELPVVCSCAMPLEISEAIGAWLLSSVWAGTWVPSGSCSAMWMLPSQRQTAAWCSLCVSPTQAISLKLKPLDSVHLCWLIIWLTKWNVGTNFSEQNFDTVVSQHKCWGFCHTPSNWLPSCHSSIFIVGMGFISK